MFQALASKLHTACHKAWRCLDRNRLRHGGFSFSDGGDGTIRSLLSALHLILTTTKQALLRHVGPKAALRSKAKCTVPTKFPFQNSGNLMKTGAPVR